ncbi:hypothetical protein OAS67_05485 [Alphaproteobacteria bacterium]|nr:hypothetical protein [Alphaproteobacteria bacterium]
MRPEVIELSANPLPDIPCQTSRMKNLTTTLCLTLAVLLWTTMSIAKADSWVDEDGGAIVKVQDGIISIYSLNSFFYFDGIFSNVMKHRIKVRVCMGFNEPNRPKDCRRDMATRYSIHNKGKNRAIHVKMSSFPFIISAFEGYLKSGRTMKISFDDGDFYAAYILDKTHVIDKESKKILALPDQSRTQHEPPAYLWQSSNISTAQAFARECVRKNYKGC